MYRERQRPTEDTKVAGAGGLFRGQILGRASMSTPLSMMTSRVGIMYMG